MPTRFTVLGHISDESFRKESLCKLTTDFMLISKTDPSTVLVKIWAYTDSEFCTNKIIYVIFSTNQSKFILYLHANIYYALCWTFFGKNSVYKAVTACINLEDFSTINQSKQKINQCFKSRA